MTEAIPKGFFAYPSTPQTISDLDTSIVEAHKRFEQLRILTTVGYTKYCNSRDIEAKFYTDRPDTGSTIFESTLFPNLPQGSLGKLVYLKNKHNTQASTRISERIEESAIPLIVDDPRESSVQTLTWYGTQVHSSLGVVCHFASPSREGALLHNARYALVAGMARGFKRHLLMLEEGDFFIPVDYRDLLRQYNSAAQATSYVNQWLQPIEAEWSQQTASSKAYAHSLALATELKSFNVGEYIAENEATRLTEDYFVETAAFAQALQGKTVIFVGRKGAGKQPIS